MTEEVDDIKHGTYAGAGQHKSRGVPLCDDCREAARKYMSQYRRKVGSDKDRWWNQTKLRARDELVNRHREEYEQILAEIRETERAAGTYPQRSGRETR